MTQRACTDSRRNRTRVLRPKPKNRPPDGFETQTTNLPEEAYPLRLLRPLDMCHRRPRRPITKSSSAPLDLVNHHLDLVNTVTPHVLLHLSMTQVLATHGQSPRFSSPSVEAPASVLER